MDIEIKRLGLSDVKLGLGLLEVQKANSINEIEDKQEIVERRLSDESVHVIVGIENNRVVGGLVAYRLEMFKRNESKMFLYEIDVEKDYRRKGIGSRLIENLIDLCEHLNCTSIFLCTEVENIAAKELYGKMEGRSEIALMYSFDLSK